MKIYNVQVDANKYQLLLPISKSDEVYDMLDFKGLPKKEVWHPIKFYVDNPLCKKGDFFSFVGSTAFACNKRAAEKLWRFWNMSSELLPIYLEDETQLFVVNVIDCVNALDKNLSEFDYYEDGTISNRILKYNFHKNRFHESTIFKIPETAKIQILTFTGLRSSEDEFYNAYMESGLDGLMFEEIYSDE